MLLSKSINNIDTIVSLSGGIDSVGSLFWALSKKSIAAFNFCIWSEDNHPMRPWINNHQYQRDISQKICDQLNIPLITADIKLNNFELDKQFSVHQRYWLATQLGLVVKYNPQIKFLYIGGNKEDFEKESSKKTEKIMIDIVKSMNCQVELSSPLAHLTKNEISKLIPIEFLKMTTMCFEKINHNQNPCMKCRKCKELEFLDKDTRKLLIND